VLVAYPILAASAAGRRSATSEWAADLGEELRAKAKVKQRARSRAETDKARGMDAKLARGSAMTRPYAVATVTVPKTVRVAEFGRRLDASIRRAGFAPLRLDLSQDAAFAASAVPLGIGLTRAGDA
jgi:ribosomal protein S4